MGDPDYTQNCKSLSIPFHSIQQIFIVLLQKDVEKDTYVKTQALTTSNLKPTEGTRSRRTQSLHQAEPRGSKA